MRARPRPSLKARAIALLAQREHSRSELKRKLLRIEERQQPQSDADAPGSPMPDSTVEALLDWLETNGYLSHARFAESRVIARAGRFGAERIRQELARHGVPLEPEALRALKDTELARAAEIWRRKYGARPGADAAERARQARFLAGRGFALEVIRRVVKGLPED